MTKRTKRRWARALLFSLGAIAILAAAATGFAWWYDHVGQRSDPAYHPKVASPAYPAHDRSVLIDAGHNNFHTASGRYRAFAMLLRADGLIVRSNPTPISAETLRKTDLLVIANAMGPSNREDANPFTAIEKDAIANWVTGGGALLLIADHAPFGASAQSLSSRFGVTMHLRYARDDQNHDGWDNERLLFSTTNGLLPSNPISNGRTPAERVRTVVSFTGQSLSGPASCEKILPLAPTAYDWESRSVRYAARGHSQALACSVGHGRVFVLGEAAMFSAQVDPLGYKFGMNRPRNDDAQFALNVVHWLIPPQ